MDKIKKYTLGFKTNLPSKIDYERHLNPEQKKVVFEADGPSLVLAGAGSGKTRTLVFRLAYLIEKGVSLYNILLATFTNKASREMLSRAEGMLRIDLKSTYSGTFHHIANLILRKEANKLGYQNNFTILDREDAKDLLDDIIEDLGFDRKEKLFPKSSVLERIFNLAVNSLQHLEEVIYKKFNYLEDYIDDINVVFDKYRKRKKKNNLMDYDDLLYNLYKLLEDKELSRKYSQRFVYILVDEYQDTNRLQFKILKELSQIHKNILVVGDDSQSIYSFRAAEIKNILEFPQEFSGTRIFKLEQNYRSTPQILNLANRIIAHNKNQFHKVLHPVKREGILPWVCACRDTKQEARFVVQKIREHLEEGVPLKDMAVLFRSHFQSLDVEMELIKHNIPYVVRGGLRFFEQAHIKDILSFLKIVSNPKDELSFKRALKLQRGIGKGYAQRVWKKYQDKNHRLEMLLKEKINLPKNPEKGFEDFCRIIKDILKIKEPSGAIESVLGKFYKDYAYLAFEDPQERIFDIQQLARIARGYKNIKKFLEELSFYESFKGEVVLGNSSSETMVLSTIHQAKGLEWEAVFIIGCIQGQFPHPESLNSLPALEEERRLFYVAATRTKSYLYITYPQLKYDWRSGAIITKRSLFLEELDEDLFQNYEIEEEIA